MGADPTLYPAQAAAPERDRGAANAAEAKRLLAGLEVKTLLVQPGSGSGGGVTFGKGAVSPLTAADAQAIAHDCPAVQGAAPIVRVGDQAVYERKSWVPLYVFGTTPSYLKVRDWQKLKEGDPFTDRDVRQGVKVCLLGQTVAHELFSDASPVGKNLRLPGMNLSLRVVGVLRRKGANVMGLDQDDIVLLPWTALEAARSADRAGAVKKGPAAPLDPLYPGTPPPRPKPPEGVDQILVQARSEAEVPAARREVSDLLRKRHRIRRGQPDDFHVRDLLEMKKALQSAIGK